VALPFSSAAALAFAEADAASSPTVASANTGTTSARCAQVRFTTAAVRLPFTRWSTRMDSMPTPFASPSPGRQYAHLVETLPQRWDMLALHDGVGYSSNTSGPGVIEVAFAQVRAL